MGNGEWNLSWIWMVKLMGYVHSYKLLEYDTVMGAWMDHDAHVK